MENCNDSLGKIKGIWYICEKYNYREKVWKAFEENNFKYINMLIKKGKVEYISNE